MDPRHILMQSFPHEFPGNRLAVIALLAQGWGLGVKSPEPLVANSAVAAIQIQGERAASGRGGGQDQGRRGHMQLSEHAQKDRAEIRVGKGISWGKGNKGKSKKKKGF